MISRCVGIEIHNQYNNITRITFTKRKKRIFYSNLELKLYTCGKNLPEIFHVTICVTIMCINFRQISFHTVL